MADDIPHHRLDRAVRLAASHGVRVERLGREDRTMTSPTGPPMSDAVYIVRSRVDAAMASFRAAPSAEAIDEAYLIGRDLARVELLAAIAAIEPIAYRSDAADGPEWVAAIPVEKLKRVLEESR